MRNHGAALIRVDVWTTNSGLYAYFQQQRFTRCPGRDPAELDNYPAQALFEREIEQAGEAHTRLITEVVAPGAAPHQRGTRDHRDAGRGRVTPVTRPAL